MRRAGRIRELDDIKLDILDLNSTDQNTLYIWLRELMTLPMIEEEEVEVKSSRATVEGSKRTFGKWTVQLEWVKCGKESCKNDKHGPYWYGYRKEGGKLKSKYIGKTLTAAGVDLGKDASSEDYVNLADEVRKWNERLKLTVKAPDNPDLM